MLDLFELMEELEIVEALENAKTSNDNYRFKDEVIDFLIASTKKQIPQPIDIAVFDENRIAGYCPTCEGTVLIHLCQLRKFKGACCSWCGQKFLLPDLSEGGGAK